MCFFCPLVCDIQTLIVSSLLNSSFSVNMTWIINKCAATDDIVSFLDGTEKLRLVKYFSSFYFTKKLDPERQPPDIWSRKVKCLISIPGCILFPSGNPLPSHPPAQVLPTSTPWSVTLSLLTAERWVLRRRWWTECSCWRKEELRIKGKCYSTGVVMSLRCASFSSETQSFASMESH